MSFHPPAAATSFTGSVFRSVAQSRRKACHKLPFGFVARDTSYARFTSRPRDAGSPVRLGAPRPAHEALWRHLLPRPKAPEEAAFVFAIQESDQGDDRYRYVEWYPVPSGGFASRSSVHFELTDEVRARVIKRAHDLGASLVELHSHTGSWPASFSVSDIMGFREFVPHVRWRLKGRPYLAVVVTRSGFDAVVWANGPDMPSPLDGIVVKTDLFRPTGLTRWDFRADDD